MTTLQFADTHNLVAFLAKPTESEGYRQGKNCQWGFTVTSPLVDGKERLILTEVIGRRESSTRRLLKDSGNIDKTQSKATPNESSSPRTSSSGGPRHQETMGDTIAQTRSENVSKLYNDPLLARGNTLQSGEDRLKLQELMELCTTLQSRVLSLENTKTAQAQEITSLKLRVKKLEKKAGSKTHKLKRLNKDGDLKEQFPSDEASFGGEQGVPDSKKGDAAQVSTAATLVSTANTILVSAALITDIEITLAQALEELKTAKPTTAASTRPKAKRLVIHEQDQAPTPIVLSYQPSQVKIQDKGKAKMIEPEPVKKLSKKDQLKLDEEVAQRLQAREQEELIIEERAILFQQLLEKKKEARCSKKSRREKEQTTNKSSTKEYHVVNTFVDMDTELVKESSKKADVEIVQESSSKRAGDELEQENEATVDVISLATKPPTLVDWKIHKEGKKSYYQIIKADGSLKMYLVFSHMLNSFDREDLETLYKLVKAKVEERLTIELVEGREVEKIVTTVTKNGVVTRYPRKFHEYQLTDKEKEIEKMMIYWEQVEYEMSDDDDSALKSTARSVPKDYELGDTSSSTRYEVADTSVRGTVAVRGVSTRYCSDDGWTNQRVTRGTGVCQSELIIDHFLSCNKNIPSRFDAEMHSEGQDSHLTKLINTIDGKFKFGMEIPDTMLNDAIKQSSGYKYYKHKKDESEKGKVVEEPKEHHVSPVRSGRGKGYMCSGNQEVNVPRKPKKAIVPKKPRTLIVADNIVEETVAVELAKSESRLESMRKERQAVGGEESSAAHDKYYEFEDISATDSDATRDSSCLDTDEEKDDETNDSEDLDMDLSDDEPNKGDDDVAGFGIFVDNKSQELAKFTPFSPVVITLSIEDFSNLLNDPPMHELIDLLSKPVYINAHTTSAVANPERNLEEMFPNDVDHHTSSPPANTTHDLVTKPQHKPLQAKAKMLMAKDPPNDDEGETRKKRRKDIGEPSSRSSKKDKALVVPVQEDTHADQPQDQEEDYIQKRPNARWFNKTSGSTEAARRKLTWFDMLLKSNIDPNEDYILGPSTVVVAKKLKVLINKDELAIAHLEGARLEKLKEQYKNDVELEYHVDQLKAAMLTKA
ncbi:hypothetical protein Tco_0349139 [Tanacetum coccineum]